MIYCKNIDFAIRKKTWKSKIDILSAIFQAILQTDPWHTVEILDSALSKYAPHEKAYETR